MGFSVIVNNFCITTATNYKDLNTTEHAYLEATLDKIKKHMEAM